jgi:hypothetical protein
MSERSNVLRGEWLALFCFMTSSARGLVGEPVLYGPFRIVDSLEKILELLEKQDLLSDEFLKTEREKIVEKKLVVVIDEDEFVDFLDELVMDFTKELKKETL